MNSAKSSSAANGTTSPSTGAASRHGRGQGNSALDQCVRETLDTFFRDLRGTEPNGLHEMLVKAIELPLLDVVMQRADGNQSRAAEWLGINRNTLRRKLAEHKL